MKNLYKNKYLFLTIFTAILISTATYCAESTDTDMPKIAVIYANGEDLKTYFNETDSAELLEEIKKFSNYKIRIERSSSTECASQLCELYQELATKEGTPTSIDTMPDNFLCGLEMKDIPIGVRAAYNLALNLPHLTDARVAENLGVDLSVSENIDYADTIHILLSQKGYKPSIKITAKKRTLKAESIRPEEVEFALSAVKQMETMKKRYPKLFEDPEKAREITAQATVLAAAVLAQSRNLTEVERKNISKKTLKALGASSGQHADFEDIIEETEKDGDLSAGHAALRNFFNESLCPSSLG